MDVNKLLFEYSLIIKIGYSICIILKKINTNINIVY